MFKEQLQKNMGIIGALGQLLFYFQAINIFLSKKVGEVSLVGFAVAFISLSCCLLYGIVIKDMPLIVANVIGFIGASLVITGILTYGY
jgi:MtN3 and saliva related transmembrane protein